MDETIIRGIAMRERKASMVVRFALPLAFLLCAWPALRAGARTNARTSGTA